MLNRSFAVTAMLGFSISLLQASTAQAVVVADSAADFSGTQGLNNWENGQYTPVGEPVNPGPGAFSQLPTWTGSQWQGTGSFSTPIIGTTFMHPANDGRWAVRRYTVEPGVSGLVNISGTLQHSDGGGGDGIEGRIYVNNQRAYRQLAGAGDTAVRNFSFNIQVNPGDVIDVVSDDRGDFSFDATQFAAQVDTTPRIIVADSFRDFSSTQAHADQGGSGTWQYGHFSTINNPGTFTTAGWTFGGTQWNGPGGTSILTLNAAGGHPDGNSAAFEPVRRWTSGVSGEVQLDLLLRKNNEDPNAVANGSEGITANLFHNGVLLQSIPIAATDNDSKYFTLPRTVAVGDTIDLVVNRDGPGGGNNFNFDGFDYSLIVSQAAMPEPASLALLAFGAAALGLRRRLR